MELVKIDSIDLAKFFMHRKFHYFLLFIRNSFNLTYLSIKMGKASDTGKAILINIIQNEKICIKCVFNEKLKCPNKPPK